MYDMVTCETLPIFTFIIYYVMYYLILESLTTFDNSDHLYSKYECTTND